MTNPFDFGESLRKMTDLTSGGAIGRALQLQDKQRRALATQLSATSALSNFDPTKYGTTNILDMSRYSSNIVSDALASYKMPSTVVASTVNRWFDASAQPAWKVALPSYEPSWDITQLVKPALSTTILDQALTKSTRSAGLAALINGPADPFKESANIVQQAMSGFDASKTVGLASSRFNDFLDQQRAALDLVSGNHRKFAGAMSLVLGDLPKFDFASYLSEPVAVSRLLASINVADDVAERAFVDGDEDALGKIIAAAMKAWAEIGTLLAQQKTKLDNAGPIQRWIILYLLVKTCTGMVGDGIAAYGIVENGVNHAQSAVSAIVRHFDDEAEAPSSKQGSEAESRAETASPNAIAEAARIARETPTASDNAFDQAAELAAPDGGDALDGS